MICKYHNIDCDNANENGYCKTTSCVNPGLVVDIYPIEQEHYIGEEGVMANTDDFYKLVESMRTAQKRYFKTRDANYLEESRKLEKAVDKALAEHEELKRGGRLF